MIKKVVLCGIMILMFCNVVPAAEIGLVQTSGSPTCGQAKLDFKAAAIRYNQLKEMSSKMKDASMKLVIDHEIDAVLQLATSIRFWQNENCRST